VWQNLSQAKLGKLGTAWPAHLILKVKLYVCVTPKACGHSTPERSNVVGCQRSCSNSDKQTAQVAVHARHCNTPQQRFRDAKRNLAAMHNLGGKYAELAVA